LPEGKWGVNLVGSETQFNLSAAGSDNEFGNVASTVNPIFPARHGFVGVDFGPFGNVAIGIDFDSVTAAGQPGYSVFTAGFRYDFSWRTGDQQ